MNKAEVEIIEILEINKNDTLFHKKVCEPVESNGFRAPRGVKPDGLNH